MPDYYEQPDYLKDLYNTPVQPVTPVTGQPAPAPSSSPIQPIQPQPNPVPPVPSQIIPPPVKQEVGSQDPKRRRLLVIVGIIGGILLLGIILVLLLNRGGTQETKQSIVLQWWGAFLEEEVVQPLLDEYTSQNSHVTIEYANRFRNTEAYTSEVDRYKTELNRVLEAGNQVEIPDIFMVDSTWVGDYEQFARVSNSYDATTFRNSFYDVVLTNFMKGNQIYGVPLWIDTFAVLYNKDLLAQQAVSTPPETWAAFKTLAQNLTKRQNNVFTQTGFAAGTASNVSYAPDILQVLILQNGVTLADANGQPQFAEDEDTLSALTFYKSFLDTTAPTWTTSYTNDSSAFLEGKVAMIIVPSYRYREILRFNEQYEIGLDIGVSKLPQVDGSTEEINWSDYWGNMVANNRPNSTESWKFLNWITQPDQLKKLSENVENYYKYFGIVYPRKDMNSELAADENLRVFNEGALNARSWYMVKGLEVEEEFKNLINSSNTSTNQIQQTQENIEEIRENQGEL